MKKQSVMDLCLVKKACIVISYLLHCYLFLGDISPSLEEWIAMKMKAEVEYNKIARIIES